jgi:spermidine/putrescine-binding protein
MILLQKLAANARYFTDSASKIPHDVAMGNSAAGTCIDFYGRSFEDAVRDDSGSSRVRWTSPVGGTSLNVDSIAIMRGAPHMEIAQEFVTFCLSERGQLLWNRRPGSPDGPKERALRRLPVRRDFYTAKWMEDFTDAEALPYERTGQFVYQPDLTVDAFDTLRVVFRAMCMDPHEEMKEAWNKLAVEGDGNLSLFHDVSAVNYGRVMRELVPLVEGGDPIELTRIMTGISRQFRENYRRAAKGEGARP